ncbi:MAG TPA: hypothetical protein VF773_04040 [Verrucomicrobiae bacterium]
MTRIPVAKRVIRALLLTAATFAATFTQAQTPDFIVNNFDTEDEAAAWSRWWGAAEQTYSFDPTVDANNNAASGSLKVSVEFDRAAYGGDNQFATQGAFPENATVDGSQYTNLVFDLRWDPASPKRAGGDFGFLEIGFRKADFSQLWLPSLTVPATAADGWIRVTLPINPGAAGVDQLTGIALKMWSGDANTGFIGTSTFWIDNVRLEGREDTTIPQPTLFIDEAGAGLEVFASASGQYQRQNIRTVDTSQSWVGASGPVTYSFTIADYPDATHNGFQTHLFLVPGDNIPTFETSPDWNQPNLIFLDLQNSADGGAFATFRHKTNSPNGNAMIYNANPTNGPVGALAGIGATDIRGTWSLTFSNDTSVTITTPQGTSTNFTISAETAALFANPMYAYLGIQPNRIENLGQSARFTSFNITGTTTPITENFVGVVPEETPDAAPNLDPAIWLRVAENAAGVTLVPTNSTYIISWTVPAVGFNLQHSASLSPQLWEDVTTPTVQIGDRVRTTLSTSGQTGFFRLIKP